MISTMVYKVGIVLWAILFLDKVWYHSYAKVVQLSQAKLALQVGTNIN